MAESSGVWLYAVMDHVSHFTDVVGISGSPVRAIEEQGLAAVVSDVDLEEFSESRLHASLDDMRWLETTATAHHRVIDELARARPVVPMRLATVFTDDQSARAMLAQRGPELKELLGRIGDRIELGVKAFAAPADAQPRPPKPSSEFSASSGSGLAYLQRRRDELAASNSARQDAARSAREVHMALARLAVDTRLHPPQVHELAGTKAPMLLNAAYLVQDVEQDLFGEAVGQLAEQHPAVRLHLTGPWPPYSFAGIDDGESDSA